MTLFTERSATDKRQILKEGLLSGKLLRFPGSFSPYISLMIENTGFEGVYISGAALSSDLGLPDVGLTTLTEVCQRGTSIARASNLPSIIDADTGFGESMNCARSILEFENAGLSGCHIEDQEFPKRCGHLDKNRLLPIKQMTQKIISAVKARRDNNFVIIARTDARQTEGLNGAIERARTYLNAGADMIFPEALQDEDEFSQFREQVQGPLMANMTEFGKSPLIHTKKLQSLGYNLVIYPVTTFRLAMHAVENGLETLAKEGSQESLLGKMQHRKRLYEILKYDRYEAFDSNVYNFHSSL